MASSPGPQVRAATVLLAGLIALVIALAAQGTGASPAVVSLAASRGGVETLGSGLTPPQLTPTSPSRSLAQMYRIAGCRSDGVAAYFHGPRVREVAIGFDDGPAPDTGAFVTMLERVRAQATFFMIGRQIDSAYRAVMLRELRNGDVLGDHTFTHPDLLLRVNVRRQLLTTLAAIREVTGYTPCVFRPPYGAYNTSVVGTARSLGLATVLWNVDPRDWSHPGIAAIVRTALAEVEPGSIIISHDGGGPRGETLAAYPRIIAALRRRGYRIVTIPELLGFRPVYTPCVKLCDGIGVTRSELPRSAIVQRAP